MGKKIEVYSARERSVRQKRISFTPNWIYRILCAVAYHSANSNIRSTQNEMFFGVAQFFPFLCQLNFPTNFSFFVERQRKIFFALVAKKIATLIALKFSIDFQMIISSELFFSFEVFTCEQSSSFLLPIRVKRSTNKVAELYLELKAAKYKATHE